MRAVVEASDEVEVTIRPGVTMVRSLMSLTPVSCSSCLVTLVTTIGTSCRFCSRRCAVTVISSTLVGAADWASAGAATLIAIKETLANAIAENRMGIPPCGRDGPDSLIQPSYAV